MKFFTIILSFFIWTQGFASEALFVGGKATHPITFGLEIEVDLAKLRDADTFLRFYKPAHIPSWRWLRLDDDERFEEGIRAQRRSTEFSRVNYDDASMKPAIVAFYKKLPRDLLNEVNGNLELRGSDFVFSKLDDLKDFLEQFEKLFGEGDLQTHIVFPKTPLNGATGYVIYEHDRAMLRRFTAEYETFMREANRSASASQPASNAVSLYLGLLDAFDKQRTRYAETWSKHDGELYVNGNIGFSRRNNAMKALSLGTFRVNRRSAPIFRNASYPEGHVGFELRMEDNPSFVVAPNLGASQRLVAALGRVSQVLAHTGSLEIFARFGTLTLPSESWCDGGDDDVIEGFVASLKSKVLTRQQHKTCEGLSNSIDEQGSSVSSLLHDGLSPTFLNNFLFPLRDWESHPILAVLSVRERATVVSRIEQAKIAYLVAAKKILEEQADLPESEPPYRALRIALAAWAHKVNLVPLFERFEDTTIKEAIRGQASEDGMRD